MEWWSAQMEPHLPAGRVSVVGVVNVVPAGEERQGLLTPVRLPEVAVVRPAAWLGGRGLL